MRVLAPLFGLTLLVTCLLASAGEAAGCRALTHDGNRYTICEAGADDDIRLFLHDNTGALLGHFGAVNDVLKPEGKRLMFGMNAGMYHDDRRPVGLYVEGATQKGRLITRAGPGNFGLVPNGVFCIGEGRADVIETLRFEARNPRCRYATQSGPMLVIDGALHPRFLPDSTSRHVRNGVGTSADGKRVVFAISENRVTFHEFGRLFRDVLKLQQALYLDGSVSRLYSRDLNRADAGFPLGPIVGVVTAD